jgi:ferrous iron transport protein B
MKDVAFKYEQLKQAPNADILQLNKELQTAKLENSYAGILGKSIEPAITP